MPSSLHQSHLCSGRAARAVRLSLSNRSTISTAAVKVSQRGQHMTLSGWTLGMAAHGRRATR
eukprot:6731032-Prymnesium_polylepis.1